MPAIGAIGQWLREFGHAWSGGAAGRAYSDPKDPDADGEDLVHSQVWRMTAVASKVDSLSMKSQQRIERR
jgi:hypothetical protein